MVRNVVKRCRWAIIICFILFIEVHLTSSKEASLYDRLGVRSSASQNAIKKAYRAKARATHPDKNPSLDPTLAAANFRAVVEAYETLSDTNSRREYDRSGRTAASQKANSANQQSGSGSQSNNNFNFNWQFNFRFTNQQHQQPRLHRLLYDYFYRPQIIDARSRVVSVQSLEHLQSVTWADDDSDLYDENNEEQRLERYVLLAFYDSSIPMCEHKLDNEVLYPWPYAGYSSEGQGSSSSIWWDEIMFTGKVDLKHARTKPQDAEKLIKLGEYFGIEKGLLTAQTCPSIILLPRGGYLSDRMERERKTIFISENFRHFIWPQLKMKIIFENKTPFLVKFWWLDGNRGIPQDDIMSESTYEVSTFLSHSFFFRAGTVSGNALTNQVNFFFDVTNRFNLYLIIIFFLL